MLDIIFEALWIFLPAGLANGSPVLASRLPLLKEFSTPLDLGKHYRGKRLLGPNKTWRGLIVGTLVGALTAFIQSAFVTPEYSVSPLLFGGLLGFGALLGDAIESFIKRQKNVPAGESWFPFDQLDYVIGGLAVGSLIHSFSLRQIAMILVVWMAAHIVSVYVFFLLGVRDKPI